MSLSPKEVIMVRPASFGYNLETSLDNAFQNNDLEKEWLDLNLEAQKEFDGSVINLRNNGVTVHIFEDSKNPEKPDAIFPNNWFSTHENGLIVVYPLLSKTRRIERRPDVVQFLEDNYKVTEILDLSHFEEQGQFLEGTGSIVFDFLYNKAYACRSSRTCSVLLDAICSKLNYTPMLFTSKDKNGIPFYHTNVMMWIGSKVAAICAESISDEKERELVLGSLRASGREVLELSLEEVSNFAGNCFELEREPPTGKQLLAISSRALKGLSTKSRSTLEKFVDFVECNVDTIEHVGGGGIRCMLAAVHLPLQ